MKKRWGKGEPVNLSDLLKITPVANEIMQLSEELDMSTMDVLWIVSQIIDNTQEEVEHFYGEEEHDPEMSLEDDWEEIDMDSLDGDMDKILYTVNVKICSNGRFPEVGFKAGVTDKEDMNYFFDMVMDMLDKLD